METYQHAGRKMEMHMLPATSIGDCMIVKFQNKSMLIDTNSQVDKVKTIESCKQLASKIDYIMISHYHDDHVGVLEEIAGACDIRGATVFLPQDIEPSYLASSEELSKTFSLVQNVIANYELNAVYPDENTMLNIDGVEITFYNTDHDDYYAQGNADTFDYNNMSLCALFKLGHTSIFFSGDLALYGQQKITGALPPVTILKTPHHAGDPIDYSHLPFYQLLRPKLMLGCSPCGDGWDWLRHRSFVYKYAQANNIDNYATGNTGEKLVLYVDDYGYHLDGGKTFTLELTPEELHICKGVTSKL